MNLINQNTNRFLTENRRLLFFFLLFLLSSMGMFGQNKADFKEIVLMESSCSKIEITASSDLVSVESQIDFVGWFMGSKQSQFIQPTTNENSGSKAITKKQILSSGITPNKVLYRTFMKKVSSQDNAIV